jgi:monothiol glutaredoxin
MGLLDRVRNKLKILGPGSAEAPIRPLPRVSLEPEPESTRGGQPVEAFVRQQIADHRVFLFMKGSPDAPRCGFSANVAAILASYQVTYGSFDVLSDDEVRAGVKMVSAWPTFPQLFVNGELVGGSDIVSQLHQSGELAAILAPAAST